MIEFKQYPKTPRLFRDIVVSEKLDGSNSAIIITEWPDRAEASPGRLALVSRDGVLYEVGAQSRNRLIYPGKTTDNYGFAEWVHKNAQRLFDLLGPGRHSGEWWGQGIARKYGMDYRVFSLFNTPRDWPVGLDEMAVGDHALSLVPVLYEGEFFEDKIISSLARLQDSGSVASPGFMNPEGVCVFHTQSGQVYKVTLDNNDKGKWNV